MSVYPLTCKAGYNVPVKQGKYEVTGFSVTVLDPAADSYFAIVDDEDIVQSSETGRLLTTLTGVKNVLCHIKGLANIDTLLSYEFSEPVKTRYGVSIYGSNMVAGSVCVYSR
ncbi:MAG: hypothetical protein KKB31_08020 [Nanoarchaeota archaeon]|nr:hypothetical protein [Nanoarchaeota archaeon]